MFYDRFIDNLTISNATCFFAKFVSILLGGMTYAWLNWHESRVMRAQPKGEARALILPLFRPLMLFIIIFMILENTAFFVLVTFEMSNWFNVLQWSMFQIPREGVCMIFIQRSLSRNALRRAFYCALLWSLYGCVMGVVLNVVPPTDFNWNIVAAVYHFIPSLFHAYMLLSSYNRSLPFSPRESLIPFNALMLPGHLIWCVIYIILACGVLDTSIPWLFICAGVLELPMMPVWLLLFRADTHYWQYGGIWSWLRSPEYFALDEDDGADDELDSAAAVEGALLQYGGADSDGSAAGASTGGAGAKGAFATNRSGGRGGGGASQAPLMLDIDTMHPFCPRARAAAAAAAAAAATAAAGAQHGNGYYLLDEDLPSLADGPGGDIGVYGHGSGGGGGGGSNAGSVAGSALGGRASPVPGTASGAGKKKRDVRRQLSIGLLADANESIIQTGIQVRCACRHLLIGAFEFMCIFLINAE